MRERKLLGRYKIEKNIVFCFDSNLSQSKISKEACFSTIATGNKKKLYACFIVSTNLAENLQVKNYIHYLLIGKIFFYGLCPSGCRQSWFSTSSYPL